MTSVRYLLDTNILSDAAKVRPSAVLARFLEEVALPDLFVSAISVGEIRRGIEIAPSEKRVPLSLWFERDVLTTYQGRILPADAGVMDTWGRMVAATGRPPGQLPLLDSLIAATALHHRLTVVTRNLSDFGRFGVLTLNPYEVPA